MSKLDFLLVKTHRLRPKWQPTGLMYVAKALENVGAKVKILDLFFEKNPIKTLESILIRYKPNFVGIGGLYSEFDTIEAISKTIKDIDKNIKVIVGGPIAGVLTNELLKIKYIDIVALREGESISQDIFKYSINKMPLEEIRGIVFKKGDDVIYTKPRPIEDIDAIPIPSWHLIEVERYITTNDNWFGKEHLRMLNIVPARGCPYSCIFCDKSVFGNKWRGRNPKNIVDEIVMLKTRYNIQAVMFLDDIFDVNKKWVFSFIDELKSRNVNIYWGCSSRVNHADYELYKKMREAGCLYIFYGIEFGSDEILKRANKGFASKDINRAIDIAKSAGLRVVGSYMLGMLDETEEDIEKTIKSAINSKIDVGGISVLTPIASTVLFDMAVKSKKIDPNKPYWRATRENAYINLTKNLSNKRLAFLRAKAYWVMFWTRPSRKLPKWFCKIMEKSFFIFRPFIGDRFMNFIHYLDSIRKKLHLGLP